MRNKSKAANRLPVTGEVLAARAYLRAGGDRVWLLDQSRGTVASRYVQEPPFALCDFTERYYY